jgi:uncharacterized protein (DUF2141 family)
MKKTTVMLLLFWASFVLAQNQLKIEVKGLKNSKGLVQIALYNHAAQFLQNQYATATVRITAGKTTAFFEALPKGIYAAAVFHDENSNAIMDKGLFGIPKEAYGFSNNAKGFMSAPTFDAAKFQLNQDLTIEIKVN